ncbi:MAG: nucleotidyltransferase domain-containing protein [Syntrophomonadaceae bacterium]|nr:nucleotidyltransferase domain-containing protein [Syntrophomonadaceae bacterium]
MKKEELNPTCVIEGLNRFLQKNEEIIAVYLFGSYAKDNKQVKNDVDVAVLLDNFKEEKEMEILLRYKRELENQFCKDVDVVILNTAPPLLKQQIFYYGIKVNERDRKKLVDFRVKSYFEQFDLLEINKKIFAINKEKINRRIRDGR